MEADGWRGEGALGEGAEVGGEFAGGGGSKEVRGWCLAVSYFELAGRHLKLMEILRCDWHILKSFLDSGILLLHRNT